MCFICSTSQKVGRRGFLKGFAIAAGAAAFAPVAAKAQAIGQPALPPPKFQAIRGYMNGAMAPANFGPPPDGGAVVPEYIVPNGALGLSGAKTTVTESGMLIVYDAKWLDYCGGPGTPLHRFTRAHEFGHARLKHNPQTPAAYAQMELEADCFAAGLLRKLGDRAAIDAAMELYKEALPVEDMTGMPGWQHRQRRLTSCS